MTNWRDIFVKPNKNYHLHHLRYSIASLRRPPSPSLSPSRLSLSKSFFSLPPSLPSPHTHRETYKYTERETGHNRCPEKEKTERKRERALTPNKFQKQSKNLGYYLGHQALTKSPPDWIFKSGSLFSLSRK